MNIDLINPYTAKPLTISGLELIESGDIVFPFKNGAFRLVGDKNYAESFGFQWNKFAETQIDKSANLDLSKKRFFSAAKYFLQPLTKRMSHEKLYNKIDQNIDRLILTYQFFSGIGLGKIVNRFLPVCDLDNTLPGNLPSEKLRELCLLDTFDMFSPEFDKPQKIKTSKSWFTRYGMEKVWGGYVKYENCDAAVVKGIKRTD
jgi:hypothetical protein